MNKITTETYRILVIDEDAAILHKIDQTLRAADYLVMTAGDGQEGLQLIVDNGLPHLVLVEYDLPGELSGFDFCEKLHQFSDVPVIMIAEVDDAKVVAQAIMHHVEDYLLKPIRNGELIARVRRVANRLGDFAYPLSSITEVDENLAVNFGQCEVILSGERVSLTPTETKLLYILMRSAGRPLTTNYLLRRLWPFDNAVRNEERLRVYIHRLRNKIESRPNSPNYVVSRRGKGYGFALFN